MVLETSDFDTLPVNPADVPATRVCRNCEIPIFGPAHHTLCRSCWIWRHHRAANRAMVTMFRKEVRP